MRWWIDETNQIVGAAGEHTPSNLQSVEGVEASDRDLVYFDGTAVVLRPERPDGAFWDLQENVWVVPEAIAPPDPVPFLNWVGLETSFRNTDIFGTVWTSAKQTVRANASFTLLMSSLSSTHNLQDFVFAFSEIRAAMREQASLIDFTEEQLARIEDALIANGFDASYFDLAAS